MNYNEENLIIINEWIREKLTDLLNFQIPDEMIHYINNITSDDELSKYLKQLLNPKDPQTRKFIDELIKRRRLRHSKLVVKDKIDDVQEKYKVQSKKNKIPNEHAIHFEKKNNKGENSEVKDESQRKKNKYKAFSVEEAKTMLLKGRFYCNCEAKNHKLINNCLSCGRIICEQEGSGPCYDCGSLVCTSEESAQFNGDTSQGSKLYEKLLTKEKPKGLEEAVKHRDKLLDFDKNIRKHTHVFDDDSDYYCSTNPWLTLEQREDVQKKQKEFFSKKYDRRDKKITFTLKGDVVISEEVKEKLCNPSDEKFYEGKNEHSSPTKVEFSLENVDHIIDPYFARVDIQFKKKLKSSCEKNVNAMNLNSSRIMDVEIHQLVDKGYCLSIHQPWASFLVHGIKLGEGRTWYTSHRGKLWIVSSGHKVTRPEIESLQTTYRLIKKDIKFPADYPVGCLLGCVNVIDCLSQEQYRAVYPDGEIDDPYVFICEDPVALTIRYPVKGKPGIFSLDERIHQAALLSMKRTEKIMAESEHKVKDLRP